MMFDESVSADGVYDETGRQAVISVLGATYHREKRWVTQPDGQFPVTDVCRDNIAWFLAKVDRQPAGALRVLFDPPLVEYAKYGFELLESAPDVEDFIRSNRVAEVGRFAVLPEHRGKIMVAAALMRSAVAEIVDRGATHIVTDVFEDDPHSPLGFHTRVMGFYPIATHQVGELQSASRRITLLLDIKASYRQLSARRNWIFRYLTEQWGEALHQRLSA